MNNSSACIILAGGLGTRLRTAIPNKPKCLAPINDSSFLEIQLEALVRQGINNIIISLGYLGGLVEVELNSMNLPKPIKIRTIHEKKPLGTGGAILNAMDQFNLEECMVTNGDTYLSGSLQKMTSPLSLDAREISRMAVIEVANRSRYGGVELVDKNVTGFLEKGLTGKGFINAGFYRVNKKIFDKNKPGDKFSFESSILPALAKNNQLFYFEMDGDFMDIGIPEDYLKFCKKMQK